MRNYSGQSVVFLRKLVREKKCQEAMAKVIYCEYFNMGHGKCKCPGYVENPSKWSKGKCKRCTHEKKLHNLVDQQNQDDDNKPNEEKQNDQQQEQKEQEKQQQGGGGGGYDYGQQNEQQQEEEQQEEEQEEEENQEEEEQ